MRQSYPPQEAAIGRAAAGSAAKPRLIFCTRGRQRRHPRRALSLCGTKISVPGSRDSAFIGVTLHENISVVRSALSFARDVCRPGSSQRLPERRSGGRSSGALRRSPWSGGCSRRLCGWTSRSQKTRARTLVGAFPVNVGSGISVRRVRDASLAPFFGVAYEAGWLMLEAQWVVAARMARLAAGGALVQTEAQRMVSEKSAAFLESTMMAAMALAGGKKGSVAARQGLRVYGKRVRGNRRRLFRSKRR
jgi:hypothetical protein